MDERLSDRRRFLAGERFTAADLTFAALAAPGLSGRMPRCAARST
jgi:glutathione S-transferase